MLLNYYDFFFFTRSRLEVGCRSGCVFYVASERAFRRAREKETEKKKERKGCRESEEERYQDEKESCRTCFFLLPRTAVYVHLHRVALKPVDLSPLSTEKETKRKRKN